VPDGRSVAEDHAMKSSIRLKLAGTALLLGGFAVSVGAQPSAIVHTQIKDQKGTYVGYADLMQTDGGLLIKLNVKDLPPGQHAIHVHAVGKCDPPSFTSAGAHFNPDHQKHGYLSGEGHAGDLPNLHIPDSGALEVEMLDTRMTLEKGKPNSVLKDDGTSLVIHAAADDYKTDPAGNSGDRIACGIISSESTVGGGSQRK
jgi:Cu-Zn family superoxide dismutase